METKESSDFIAAWVGEPESTPWLITTAVTAEPLMYLLSGVLFVGAVALLVAKTKVPGRFLLLSGVILVCVPMPFFWWRFSALTPFSIDSLAVSKLVLSSAALVSALGFGRLALHIFKTERNE